MYLALEGPPPRSRLADLFWGEFANNNARRKLRRAVYRLSKTPLGSHLVQGDVVSPNAFETDSSAFWLALESGRCREALTYWRGSFLSVRRGRKHRTIAAQAIPHQVVMGG